MKYIYLLACLLLIGLLLIACNQGDDQTSDVEATNQAVLATNAAAMDALEAMEQQLAAEATAQVEAETKMELAVEATVQVAVEATLAAQPADTPEPVQIADDSERPYRSYPAPTGLPGFRLYYQKRCYPGCHTDDESEQVHP